LFVFLLQVNRTNGQLELTVDGVLQGSVSTPGTFHELNVQDGVFLGGLGTYANPQHTHLHSYRGCMKNVKYNQHDILAAARDLKSVKHAMEITWDCDREFSAGSADPVGFLSETSFVAFSRFHVRERGAFACDFKTRSENAVLLFNSGRGDFQDDFLALEILDGRPKLSVNSGSGLMEVVLVQEVNDGKWHQLDLSVSQSAVELRIDNSRNTTRFGGEQSHLNLAGHLFVGGLGLKARAHALRLGLVSLQGQAMKGSLVGCVRNIVINSRPFGFREVQVGRHVDSECSWAFPCSAEPCIEGAECVESGQMFRCICDQPVCERTDADSSNQLPGEQDIHELVAIQPLEVQEGGQVVITTNNIDVIFDYRNFRIREIAVRFRVLIPPRFGHLQVDQGQRQSEAFTLLDLLTGKVRYVHDGADSHTDDLTLEMSITGGSEVPQNLKGNFEVVLPIKVITHHDPPVLMLPSGNQINILENSKLQLTTSIVNVRDPDTKDEDLNYNVQFVRSAQSFFENYSASGEPITSFSHQNVLDGRVWFVHKEDSVVDIQFNVSDQASLEDSVVMRFLIVPLKIEVTQNTGLTVPYATNVPITTANLSATTNVPLQHLELRYRLTKQPTFGKIQRLQHGVEVWTEVDTFTQRHLNSSRLRYAYVSEDFTAAEDEFSFVISARDVDTETLTFRINFSPVSLNVVTNNRLLVKLVPYSKLENSTLLVAGDAGQVDTSKLTFTLLRAPKFGAVFLSSEGRIFSPMDFDTLRPMETGGSFTQADVDSGRVYFKFDHTGFDRLEDYMDLTVKYPSSSGRMLRAWVEYVPLDTAVRFTNNGLRDVAEGGKKVISRAQLYLQMDGYKDFRFSVIKPPRHGNLSFLDPRSSSVLEEQVEDFTTADIRKGKLTYMHDDSENDRDFFVFVVVPIFTSEEEMPEEIQEFSGTFHIFMAMRNDNPPERVVDKVFHVMRNGQKTLTLDDLAFTDKDINYDSSELQYRRQNIPNGEILMADTGEPVYQFKQKDLKEGRLVFHHRLVIQSNLS
jgi:chondroitin sulfate proteoglycan 4